MYNTSNPAELYPNTTWELLPDNKFLKTGATPLQQGGSNNLVIQKANLPAEKLQIDSFSLTRGTMEITGSIEPKSSYCNFHSGSIYNGAFYGERGQSPVQTNSGNNGQKLMFKASKSWSGSTSSATPYTANMGLGTPITINPEHIAIRVWKRLS